MSKASRRIVTFEMPQSYFDSLQEDARDRGSSSHHQRARDIVVEYLANDQLADVAQSVTALNSEFEGVRELIRRLTFVLLVEGAGKSSKVANEWIREHMIG